jgi:uncharacterized cofD-like protein
LEDSALSDLLNYRFRGEGSLAGHSLGNLMLWALADLTGDWVRAIRQLSGVLVTLGRLFPSTVVPVTLCAEDMDGRRYIGETAVGSCHPPLAQLWLEPRDAEALPEAVLALLRSDLVILSPGSLYTSTISNLLLEELQEALESSRSPVVYVANPAKLPDWTWKSTWRPSRLLAKRGSPPSSPTRPLWAQTCSRGTGWRVANPF